MKTGDTEKSLTLSMNPNGAFDINFEDGINIQLDKGFSLWDKISSIKADETEHSLQLIKKDFNDVFRLRFKGTALNVEVIPEHVAKYRKFMKEKPKLDESKIIIGESCACLIFSFSFRDIYFHGILKLFRDAPRNLQNFSKIIIKIFRNYG